MARHSAILPKNPLAAVPPAPWRGQEAPRRQILVELGFYHARKEIKKSSDAEFAQIAGDVGGSLSPEVFEAAAYQRWGTDRPIARAMFEAADVDHSGRLNRHEYLLLTEAFFSETKHNALYEIRARAIFFNYAAGGDGNRIARSQIEEWVRDMCVSESHVAAIFAELFTPEVMQRYGGWNFNAADFQDLLLKNSEFIAMLSKYSLSRTDLLRRFRGTEITQVQQQTQRVVMHEREVMAGQPESDLRDACRGDGAYYDGIPKEVDSDLSAPTSCVAVCAAINDGFRLHSAMRADGDWRGPLACRRDTDAFEIAHRINRVMHRVAMAMQAETDIDDSEWMMQGTFLADMLGTNVPAEQVDKINCLARACHTVLRQQPSLVRVSQPCKVFGNVHGQLRDLLAMFREHGFPVHAGGDVEICNYVFNGNYINGGAHQVEVVLLLFSLKIMYPTRVFLLRGSHEFRDFLIDIGERLGFTETCAALFGRERGTTVYNTIHGVFDWLPLGAVIASRILVVHGGIGNGNWTLSDLAQRAHRPLKDINTTCTSHDHILQALWSDPVDSDEAMCRGVHYGCTRNIPQVPEFGADVTEHFCRANKLEMIIRSHQLVPRGYRVMHDGRLLNVFSARNYLSRFTNDGAILLVATDDQRNLRVKPKILLHFDVLYRGPPPAIVEDFVARRL
eukprot:m.193681 g.193681  ORF g.193681 m.193681 type:complete len:676 (+) comp18639_c0_seq1:160-2187(+)